MKACVATGEKKKIICRDIPVPAVEPGWLLLKTRYACVCGSDLEYLDGAFQLITHDLPLPRRPEGQNTGSDIGFIRPGSIPGHEFIAEVVEVGKGVRGWSVGDRAIPAGHPDPQGIGAPLAGYENYKCMAEYFVATPPGLLKVPEHVEDQAAVFVEPLSTGNGAVASAAIHPGKSALIIGAGKIGLLAAMAAKVAGASPVIIADTIQSRLDKAREVGIDVALNVDQVDLITEAGKLTVGGPDAVLICVRDGKVLNQAAWMAKRGGKIVLAGFVSPMEVNPMLWTVKQLVIIGILGGNMMDALYIIARKQINPKPLISQILPFEECQRAIDTVYSGENIGVLLSP